MTRKGGFTLIELLFVIAIIGVMATLGMSLYQQRAQNVKVEKTSLQIQQLLQAAMTYYVHTGAYKWPIAGDTETPPNDFAPYIPIGNKNNPWGSPYQFKPVGGGIKFSVSTSGIPVALASRVADRLPNAEAKGGAVTAEVTVPGQSTQMRQHQLYLTSVGTVSDNHYINKPKCPSWAVPFLVTTQNWIEKTTQTISRIETWHTGDEASSSRWHVNAKIWYEKLTISGLKQIVQGTLKAFYIIGCKPA